MSTTRLLLTVLLFGVSCPLPGGAALREPVHPRRNVEEFTPVEAKFVRFIVQATNRGEPCLDELEIYSADGESRNVALAANGARATASGSLPGYAIHQLEGVNDGRYGNGRSWIADRVAGAWVQIELPQVTRISKVVWGRDREGNFIDRLATEYEVQIATDTNFWRTVASSKDREPLQIGAHLISEASISRSLVNRFAPVGTTLSTETPQTSADYRIDVWQTSDGLPGNTVTAIQQADDGYLWIGTLNGLVRFDGLRFKVFGEGSALPNTRVLSLLATRDGSLWIGTDGGGLVRFHDGIFHTLTRKDGLAADTVTALAEDGAGQIWAGTPVGLSCWHDGRIVNQPVREPRPGQPVSAIVEDHEKAFWVVAANQLFVRQSDKPFNRPAADDPSSFSTVFAAEAGHSGQLWFGGANGYIGAISNGVVHVFREQPGQLIEATWALCETRNGDLWAGTANGGLRRLRRGKFTSLTTQEGLSDNSVRCLFEDREGSLWVGNAGGGLNRVKPRKVKTFTTRDGLSHNVVMSLAEDAGGTLWVASNCGGLSARRNGVFSPYYANYLIDNECIWSLLPTPDGSLWLGTWGGGLIRMRGREVKSFPVVQPGNDEPVIAMSQDNQGGLWLGTMQSGLKSFRQGRVSEDTVAKTGPAQPVSAILQEAEGRLWVGTLGGGLLRFETGRSTTFTRREGLPSDFVRTLHRDDHGVLWIGTGGGLARLVQGKLTPFTRKQGLPDEVISQILEDERGNLWFGCNQGLFRVARRELEEVAAGGLKRVNPIAYGLAEGMESLECTGGFHPAGLKTRDGKLWFSTVKGLVMVDPANIAINETPPPVRIEEITVDGVLVMADGRMVAATDNPGNDVLPPKESGPRLGPGSQRVEFRFTALSLVAPDRNRFKYKLSDLENDWVEAGSQRVASYPHLPPGQYLFQVIAANNDGVWNTKGASLAFTVLPHYWETWWFRTLVVVVLLGGGAWAVRSVAIARLRQQLQHLQEKHAVVAERSRIAQDIHDELGANLTRIALLTEFGQKHRDHPGRIAADLEKISVTAREAVRAMDAIVWAVNPRNDSVDHFANYLSQFAEEFFRPSEIRYRLDVPADLPEHPLSTEARHHLLLAVKEALNNIVRHSGASEVCLGLSVEDGELNITVADNGQGIPSSPPLGGEHNGLGNIRKRIENLGGQFELKCRQSSGTTIVLRLPLAHSGKVRAG